MQKWEYLIYRISKKVGENEPGSGYWIQVLHPLAYKDKSYEPLFLRHTFEVSPDISLAIGDIGNEGWELVTATSTERVREYVFKRQLENEITLSDTRIMEISEAATSGYY